MNINELSDNSTILLVDDDEPVRKLVETILRKNGYASIVVAANGDRAVQLVEELGEKIDLLVCHWTMRKLDGPSVAKQIQAIRPGIAVILMSASEPERFLMDAGWVFLLKPFVATEFLEHVRALIGQSRSMAASE